MGRPLAALALSALVLASAAQAEVVSPAARARARASGTAAVVVALRAPAMPADAARALPARRARIARRLADVLATLAPADVQVDRSYQTVAGFAGRVSAAGLDQLADNPDVLRVDLDPIGHAADELTLPQIRADRVQARGVTGVGATIAVIDSGVDENHPDIADALVYEECFCRSGRLGNQTRRACCPGITAHASGPGSAASGTAHGPHVAGIALSRGHIAPIGVAPDARLVAVRVLDDANQGFLSDWIAALDYLAAERPDVRVINMSLVSNQLYGGDCGHGCGDAQGCAANLLLADAIDQLWQRGTVLFAAAGNEGRADVMGAPACIARALAVGAVDEDDAIASFSNRSPELDLFAPGVRVLSDGLAGGVEFMSGTSMASPHAAGAAALLLSARPGLGAADIERVLSSTGVTVRDADGQRSTPRIDVFAALHEAVRGAELERGGGSRGSDCLLEWNFVPPSIVQRRGWPIAVCRDNDPLCDADQEIGRCTFVFSPCFNMRDPLLRQCRVDEPLLGFSVASPAPDAPDGSFDRINVDFLASALPSFPFAGSDTCSAAIPFVVARRRADAAGLAHIRMSITTASRVDYDHVLLECLPP